jgi:hypothetical protein
MQYACAIFSSVACLAVSNYSTLSYRGHISGKIAIEREMCVLISSTTLAETFLILGRNERDIIINVHTSVWNFGTFVTWQRDWKVQKLTIGLFVISHKTNSYYSIINSEIVTGKSGTKKTLVWRDTPTGILWHQKAYFDVRRDWSLLACYDV